MELKVFKGLATCRGENFCAQKYEVCSECEEKDRLGCHDAVITIQFLDIKENVIKNNPVDKLSNSMKKTTVGVEKLTKQLKSVSNVLHKTVRR